LGPNHRPTRLDGSAYGQGHFVGVDVVGWLHRSPDNTVGSLFDWYNSGDIEVATAIKELAFMLTPQVPNTGAAGLLSWGPSARGTRCLSSDDQQR
jgi:hypothetical protein